MSNTHPSHNPSSSTQSQQQTKAPVKEINWSALLSAAGPYPMEAFNFVREGLTYTSQQIYRRMPEGQAAGEDRHISGQQLCMGLRDFAIQQYGLLAPVVLRHWNVRRTDDFGRIVFAMIAEGLMSKSADDSIEDFRMVYDFDEAFHADQLRTCIAVG